MPRAKIATKTVSDEGLKIAFEGGQELVVNLSDLSSEIQTQLALHGLSQKIGDSYAGSGGDVEEAFKLASGVAERLKAGEFKATRESTGGGRVTDLARALAEVAGVELSDAVAKLEEMGKVPKAGLKKNKHINAVLLRIQEEKLKEKAAAAAAAAEGDMEDLSAMFG